MKTHVLGALAALTIGFAVPSIAQDKNTVDPEVRQQIEGMVTKMIEAHTKHDAAAMVALFTLDAIQVLDFEGGGTASGQEAIEKWWATDFASIPAALAIKLVQVNAIGNEVSCISEWTYGGTVRGHGVYVFVRDADTWKIRLYYANTSPP